MEKKNVWLMLAMIAFITLIASIWMSFNSGKTEYAWIIGSMLFGIGCGSKYHTLKRCKSIGISQSIGGKVRR